MSLVSIVAAALALVVMGCTLEVNATLPSRDGGRSGADAGSTDGSIDSGQQADASDDGGVSEPDAHLPDGGIDGGSDGGPPFCDATDPSLQACLRFEGTLDDESFATHTVHSSDALFEVGRVGQALVVGPGVDVQLEQAGELAALPVTVELWVEARSLPTGSDRYGILDLDGEWGLFVYKNGDIQCRRNGDAIASRALSVGVFTHVACVFIETQNRIYIDGMLQGTATPGSTSEMSTANLRIGGNAPDGEEFDGSLDELRIFSAERSDADLAAAAAR